MRSKTVFAETIWIKVKILGRNLWISFGKFLLPKMSGSVDTGNMPVYYTRKVVGTAAKQEGRTMNTKAIRHWGFHMGRQALRLQAESKSDADSTGYPQKGDWYQLGERFGVPMYDRVVFDFDQKAAFVLGYMDGVLGRDCEQCKRAGQSQENGHLVMLRVICSY
jgi:hypothetical protein